MAQQYATFAGGCFWCMVKPFDKYEGVIKVASGYTGGHIENPTYEQVCSETTGHLEAVQIIFDDSIISYEKLLSLFWQQIDPTDAGGQFADRGESYTTAIFYYNEQQRIAAEQSKHELEQSGRFSEPIATVIREALPFYDAEEYHQDFYKKNTFRYKNYRKGSGRDAFLKAAWKMTKNEQELRSRLTPVQYEVTQNNATEHPFRNEFWDFEGEGIYVDIVSGEPLFSSKDKFNAHCGWPSFTKPLDHQAVVEEQDLTHGMVRVEVRSLQGDSHLGHVFEDGPGPNGLRYCINSASLRFIPKEDLEKEGYSEYTKLFQ